MLHQTFIKFQYRSRSDLLPKGKEIVVRIEHGEFPLPPRFVLQRSVRVDRNVAILEGPVQFVNMICPDIDLPVILLWIQSGEFKKVDLDLVFFHHQVSRVVRSELIETKPVDIKFPGGGFVTHGKFGVDGSEHG